MVLVMGQNQAGNILHVVTGPESDSAMAINGSLVLDITPALKQMDVERPVVLHMSKCASEQKFVTDLQSAIVGGAVYPFFPPMIVFGPKAAVEAITPTTSMKQEPTSKLIGECSLCKNAKAELVPKLEPRMCYDCVRIDLGLKKPTVKPKKPEAPHA